MAKEPKMVTCKHCGAEIAAGVKTCPQCGGRNKKPFYKNPLIIALIVVVIIAVAASVGGNDPSNSNQGNNNTISNNSDGNTSTNNTSESNSPEITYTAYNMSELMSDLETNAMKASDKYKGQYVEITGRLDAIDSDGAYITLDAADNYTLANITCYIRATEQKDVIMDATIGDTLIVKGKITDVGDVMGYFLNIDEISKAG